MRGFLNFITSRWFLTFIGALILALLVWFLGPLVDFLASIIVRASICAAILLIWLFANFLLDRHRKKADKALADGVAATAPGDAARAEEVAALRDKLTHALALLRKASGARGYLYEQPWYVIIGPPGAGKTTALLNAGLKFPLAAEMGQGAVAGVGGTRMCDWWFTEQAVMIDTAGRYTTQDSDAAVDRAGWEGFLDLLKRTRPRQPLNGVLVAIAAPDLATASPAERLEHARAVRRRIKELNDRLGLRLPIYVLFTKIDLLTGFTEFYDDLDREKRDQVWGETFENTAKDKGMDLAGPVTRWGEVLRVLVKRLNERVIDRLQAERSPDRRALLAGFPAQFSSLESPLGEFIAEAFAGSRLDPAPWLRGVYFTSGTQAGTPIDRLTGALSQLFGVDQRRAPSLVPTQGRSYFLGGLLRGVVFNEAMLATARPGTDRKRTTLRTIGFALIALLTVGIAAALLITRSQQQADADRVNAALAQYQQTTASQALDPVTSGDLSSVVPLLDQARALPYGVDHPDTGGFHWGLSQAPKYAEGTSSVYRNALERVLLPRLLVRLEGQMRDNLQRPDFLYEATHVYLMLGGQGPLDPDLARAWEQLDWTTQYPDPATQADLTKHLNALLQAPLPAVTLDWGLVPDARDALSREPVADRVYSQIKLSGAAAAEAAWTPANAVGPTGLAVFTRASGKPLTDGIPGFYTVQGFHDVLLPSLPAATEQVASESWVLGKSAEVPLDAASMQQLQDDVVKLYEKDYETEWDAMLADLTIAPLGSASQTSQTLYILASPQSPFANLMTSLKQQLTLSKNPNPAPAAATGLTSKIGGAEASRLAGLLGATTPAVPPGTDVDNYYKPFLDYVGGGPGSGAPIDLTLKLLSDLQQQVAQVAAAGAGGSAAPTSGGNNPAQLLQAEAATQPGVVKGIVNTLTGGSNQVVNSNARKAIEDAYNAPGGPGTLCHLAADGRFPFNTSASSEIPLDDFGRLFGPGGQMDSFFTSQLRPFVDTGAVWTLQPVNGVAAPISQSDLAQFQRASSIRDLFFAAGGTTPSVRFTIEPMTLDDTTKQVTLSLGSQVITYAHGPTQPTDVTWPGSGMDTVRLAFTPAPAGNTGVFEADGPWALFRLIGQGTLTQGDSPELYVLTFTQGTAHASFQLRAGSVLNPFAPGVLQDFRCPSIQ